MSIDYQDRLTQARRAALWRALEARERPPQWLDLPTRRQGKRVEQVAYSATVVFAILALALLAGVGCGVLAAIQRWAH